MTSRVPILLTTLNATYHHCAFGLRYLYANLGGLRESARLLEFTISQEPRDIAETILSTEPRVVGFGVYIWNTVRTREVVSILKRVRPDLVVILGGPEVSYEAEDQEICRLADFVVQGEGETLFRDFCQTFLETGEKPSTKFLRGPLPDVKTLVSPYPYYDDEDIKHRVIYVEASRGCPYKCEFCLSSLDKSVRAFDLDVFLADMERLMARGVRQFKFVDRTFNLSIPVGTRILQFFLERIDRGLFLHFEMVPDRLPSELRELISQFPAGSLQFEVGIQTWDPGVAKLVSRRQDYAKVRENFAYLATTGVHLHADLIVGLPGETLETFAAGFDVVETLGAHEIQVGILKRLKGTPIIRHDGEWGMVYQEHPPFQILRTKTMDFKTIQDLVRFAKFWDLFANSGNFPSGVALIKKSAGGGSFFGAFFAFSRYLEGRHPQRHSIALLSLVESAWIYLREHLGVEENVARAALLDDYAGRVKRDTPIFLRGDDLPARPWLSAKNASATPRRQTRHLS